MVVKQQIRNVVLVHGAFADGSGWKRVADILKNDGYKVSVAQPPETSYADDQKYTKAAIDAMGGPVVLVGHSYLRLYSAYDRDAGAKGVNHTIAERMFRFEPSVMMHAPLRTAIWFQTTFRTSS
jgi:pimeloyl-ACP methyl ester carboxylesterase